MNKEIDNLFKISSNGTMLKVRLKQLFQEKLEARDADMDEFLNVLNDITTYKVSRGWVIQELRKMKTII